MSTTTPPAAAGSPTAPTWLVDLAADSAARLSAMPTENQPSWFRQHMDEVEAGNADGVIEQDLAATCHALAEATDGQGPDQTVPISVAHLRTARNTMRQYTPEPGTGLSAAHVARVIAEFHECARVEADDDTVQAPVADLRLAMVVVYRTAKQRQRTAVEVMRALTSQ